MCQNVAESGTNMCQNMCLKSPPGLPPRGLFLSLNQPSRKIPEPEHLHGVGPQLPTVKGPLYAGQRKLFPHHRPRLRSLPELAIPRQPGQHRCRIAAGGFFLVHDDDRPARLHLPPQRRKQPPPCRDRQKHEDKETDRDIKRLIGVSGYVSHDRPTRPVVYLHHIRDFINRNKPCISLRQRRRESPPDIPRAGPKVINQTSPGNVVPRNQRDGFRCHPIPRQLFPHMGIKFRGKSLKRPILPFILFSSCRH